MGYDEAESMRSFMDSDFWTAMYRSFHSVLRYRHVVKHIFSTWTTTGKERRGNEARKEKERQSFRQSRSSAYDVV